MAQLVAKQEETRNENQFFSFDTQKVQVLTLDQLRNTYLENDVLGNPLRGIYHYDLIDRIITLIEQTGYTPEVYDLFAAQNKERMAPGVVLNPALEKIHGERAIQAHTLRRVFANIRLTDYDTDEFTTNLSVAFHQQGIQVGMGTNVKICHNQTMLNADMYCQTYGERGSKGVGKVSIEEMLERVADWIAGARTMVEKDREKIKLMQNTIITAEQMYQIIGMLTSIRVSLDTKIECIRRNSNYLVYPLNQAQIGRLTEKMMITQFENGKMTVWDLYNAATDQYKADAMDIPMIMPQNRAMMRFINETLL